ncbi:MAG: hypothetical protein ACI935_003832 [Moritella dasanensis]|jgi:hypothetical protein
MLKIILPKIMFYAFIFICVYWYWGESNDSTKTGLFYFVFLIAFFQNAYYGYKISKIETANKQL